LKKKLERLQGDSSPSGKNTSQKNLQGTTTDKEKKKILTDFKLKMQEGLEKRLQKSTSYKIPHG